MDARLGKKPGWSMAGLIVGAVGLTGAILYVGVSRFYPLGTSADKPAAVAPPIKQITALGRLEPMGEVIRIGAPLTLDGDRVAQLRVKEGDPVTAGQVIAILDAYQRLADTVQQAREQVRVAEARLAQVKAGAKSGELQAQRATIQRFQSERSGELATQAATIRRLQSAVQNARTEYQRFQQLYREGAIAASQLDSKKLTLDTAQAQLIEAQTTRNRNADSLQAQLQEAKATLNQIAEVRPVDIQTAQAEVSSAIAALNLAETELAQATIRAPEAGRILKIHTRVGEKLSEDGIADLGQTDQMMVVAEVYQSDIGKVQMGQSAQITGQAFTGFLRGTVSQVGWQVSRQNVFSNQPGENLDRRVVEVKIRLSPEDSQRVAGLTNLQVQVAIAR
ncbi:MAG: ABC exporter membrane fusion protein [Leptolyngbyaceae bacterium]|nr:ABC exporter membrane fusion protein [Leptolyngbyaceae bacterium]